MHGTSQPLSGVIGFSSHFSHSASLVKIGGWSLDVGAFSLGGCAPNKKGLGWPLLELGWVREMRAPFWHGLSVHEGDKD